MREPTNRGPAVDIDELEKRLRSGAPPAQSPTQPASQERVNLNIPAPPERTERPDPLAELARLMPPTKPQGNQNRPEFQRQPSLPAPGQIADSAPPARAPVPPPTPASRPSLQPAPQITPDLQRMPSAPVPSPPQRAVAPRPSLEPPQNLPPLPTAPVPPPPQRAVAPRPALDAPQNLPPLPSAPVPPLPQRASAPRQAPQVPPNLPPLPSAPVPPSPSAARPTLQTQPNLPPLPSLPPLPPLPRRQPQQGGELQPPTFTPPAPPPPAFDQPDMALRGSLPGSGRGSVGVASDTDRFGEPIAARSRPAAPVPGGAAQSPAGHVDDVRAVSPQHDSQPVDLGYAPEIPAVDPAHHARHDEEYYGEEDYGGADTNWSGEAQYASQYDEAEYDEVYDETWDEDNGPTQGSAASGIGALRRKLKPWQAIAAVSVLAVVSIGWSFLHRAGVDGSREIATIEAPEGPMKVKPAIEPESDVPTAGAAAVLDRNEPEPVKKVVNNLEQAVDPTVAPQQDGNANADAAPPAEVPGTVQLGAGRVNAPHEPPPAVGSQQPRKVKSIAVPATPVMPPAATQPPAAPQPTASTVAKPATGATFSAQFSAANSEAEARALIKTLSGKYGGKFTFKPVKSGDKTVYRVRAGGLTKEAADALCAKAKSGGDACAVGAN